MTTALLAEIDALISETEGWRKEHKRRRISALTRGLRTDASIEGAACAIRLVALKQARQIVVEHTATRRR